MYPTIESSVNEIFTTQWEITKGTVVPTTDGIALKKGGKVIDAAYLYADLAGSSKIAQSLTKEAAAKIIKAYVSTATRILRHQNGHIRSFDGDRVMAIFMGPDKESRATRAALAINWAVYQVIRPAIEKGFTDGADFCNIDHAVGIDTGEALVVRGGIRDNNDLISIGAAPNVAAKLSDIRSGDQVFVTAAVREALDDNLLVYEDGRAVWSRHSWSHSVGGVTHEVWGTSAGWEI